MASTKQKAAKSQEKYGKETLLKWYEQMMLIRKFEERASQLYMQQKFRGFCHLYIGQEAVAVGIEAAIRPDDYVITAYRDHGNALVRGVSADACMAELYGKATGCSKGKGGSMHFFSKEHNFLGGHGIVGGQIPLGAGLAFAAQYQGTDQLAVCLMGDGATRQGALHEAFNLAMLWKLPVIYVIENNNYAMGTSVERTSNVTELYKLGLSYDMPSKAVDAMDVTTVYEEFKEAVAHVRAGKGPVLIEMKTYRYRGHSMSDPAKYRTREELEKYKGRDPIANLKIYLDEHQVATETEISAIDEQINTIVEASVEFAETSPYPDPSALYENVYVGDYPYIME
ncbi:MAG: pyruvate dehydrogenase (acetyl-transferring) E1 component subunit alpha [Bacteroidia bacterium]|nr:pyruvate dehydrogenase (acetyl-transferring) E1 component subunit alpha [Bacteroidia bacterium]